MKDNNGKKDIKSLTWQELEDEIVSLGEPAYRSGQIFSWLHEKLAGEPGEITNISKKLRERLSAEYSWSRLECLQVQSSRIDATKKFLFGLGDGLSIESVFMQYHHGNTVCISSQAGCRMGCRFCASTTDGLDRNLLPGEMLEQIYEITRITGERISNVVVMGCGEPLDNYDSLLSFIRILSHEKGLHISARNVTVSTCGLVPKMGMLAREELPITLAVSLHAPNDVKRRQIMPVASKYQMDELMDACREYFDITGRRVTFEYSMIKDFNSSMDDAMELASLLKGFPCHVNLIPLNPLKNPRNERELEAADMSVIRDFQNALEKKQINVTIRRSLGRDIDGACGQLRHNRLISNENH